MCDVRTRVCDEGLRARESLAVVQLSGVAELLAHPCRGLVGMSLRATRDRSAVRCLCLTLAAGLCLSGRNRGFAESFARHVLPAVAHDVSRIPRESLEVAMGVESQKYSLPP